MGIKWAENLFKKGDDSDEEPHRTLYIGHHDQQHLHERFAGNRTRTTKYTLLSFIPKALFEQYRRLANFYFTAAAALALTPYTPYSPVTLWLPLAFVLSVSITKEAVEDIRRYQSDKRVNNTLTLIYNPQTKTFDQRKWSQVKVGDVVKVEKDQGFPCDLVFLSSPNPDGICYVETMNLDGETNLKIKQCVAESKGVEEATLADFSAELICEPPNARLYTFTGNLDFEPPVTPEPRKVSLTPQSVLLRGSSLRNIGYIYGAAIYTGHDTKVFMNATEAPSKRSRVEKVIDKLIIGLMSLLLIWCIISAVYFSWWTVNASPPRWYLSPENAPSDFNPNSGTVVGLASFVTSFILYGYLIPISLYVTVEVVKIIQSMGYINLDREMYYEETDTPANARTSNLNEELGMVRTVLSDKTGTLTRNVMEFFKCSIAGVTYGQGVTEIERAAATRKGVVLEAEETDARAEKFHEKFFNFYDPRLMDAAWTSQPNAAYVEMFLRLLALCHTVIPDGPETEKDIIYQAESPDEMALVVAGKALGFFFHKRTSNTVTIRERTARGTQEVEYTLLNVIEFNSTRKRMSVIFRDPSGKLLLFCKGADTVIYERLDRNNPSNEELKATTLVQLEEFGTAGLRTLCLAYAELDPNEYQRWSETWTAAITALNEREEKIMAAGELIEKKLVLLGCTAIEDKLQEGVPDCIRVLASAGIRLWILTGDKVETAINIGYACSLLHDDMEQYTVFVKDPEVAKLEAAEQPDKAGQKALEDVQRQLQEMSSALEEAPPGVKGSPEYAMVIDGRALGYALSPDLRGLFLKVGQACKSVICCRVSPLQKAQVTELVRTAGDVTLAIGDGANDVGMIQKAHIGVGISGQEGMQAAMSADMAIAQFRFLKPLILVHGRYSYKRITRMINFFFYKNVIFGIHLFIFNVFAVFSGQTVFNSLDASLYNVIFTVLTPPCIGIFDRDVDKHDGYTYSFLYKEGQENTYFNFKAISGWMADAALQAGIMNVMMWFCCPAIVVDRPNGHTWDLWQSGQTLYTITVLTVNLQMAITTDQFTWLHHLAIFGELVLWFVWCIVWGSFNVYYSEGDYKLFIGDTALTAQYWLLIIVTPIACVMPGVTFRLLRWLRNPPAYVVVKEHIKLIKAGMIDEESGRPRKKSDHKLVNRRRTFKKILSGKDRTASAGSEMSAPSAQNPVVRRLSREQSEVSRTSVPEPPGTSMGLQLPGAPTRLRKHHEERPRSSNGRNGGSSSRENGDLSSMDI